MICPTSVLLFLLTATVNSQSNVSMTDAVNTEDLSVPNECDLQVQALDTCLTAVYDNNPLKKCFQEQSCIYECCDNQNGVQNPAGYLTEMYTNALYSSCAEAAGLSSKFSFHLVNDFVVNEIAATAVCDQNNMEKCSDRSELIWHQLAPALTDISQTKFVHSIPLYNGNETARRELCLSQNPNSLQKMLAGFRTCVQNFQSICVNRYLATAKALYEQYCPREGVGQREGCHWKIWVQIWKEYQSCPTREESSEMRSFTFRFMASGCNRWFPIVRDALLGKPEELVWDVKTSCNVSCEKTIDNFGACVDTNADLSSHKKGLKKLLEGTSTTFQFLALRHLKECKNSGESHDSSDSGSHSGESFAELEETIQSQCFEPLKETGFLPENVTQKFRQEGCEYLVENGRLDKKKAKDLKAFCEGTKCGKKSGSKRSEKTGGKKSGSKRSEKTDGEKSGSKSSEKTDGEKSGGSSGKSDEKKKGDGNDKGRK